MDDVLAVEWLAGEATVPYVGHFEKGKHYTLQTAQAQQFIDNGSARQVKQQRTHTTAKE